VEEQPDGQHRDARSSQAAPGTVQPGEGRTQFLGYAIAEGFGLGGALDQSVQSSLGAGQNPDFYWRGFFSSTRHWLTQLASAQFLSI
jgi:hypothetical protein